MLLEEATTCFEDTATLTARVLDQYTYHLPQFNGEMEKPFFFYLDSENKQQGESLLLSQLLRESIGNIYAMISFKKLFVIGPTAISELKKLVSAGQVHGDSFVWREGMKDWKRVKEVKVIHSCKLIDELITYFIRSCWTIRNLHKILRCKRTEASRNNGRCNVLRQTEMQPLNRKKVVSRNLIRSQRYLREDSRSNMINCLYHKKRKRKSKPRRKLWIYVSGLPKDATIGKRLLFYGASFTYNFCL